MNSYGLIREAGRRSGKGGSGPRIPHDEGDMAMKRWAAALLVVVVAIAGQGRARGQAGDSALKDRVEQLVEKLGAKDPEARDAAEKALITLGAKVVPLLPDNAKVEKDETRKRLDKVRAALAEELEKQSLAASKVTIQSKGIRLTEALKQLQAQTGNRITDLREANGQDVTNPSMDLDILDKPFFEALDIVAKKAEIAVNFYTGDGTIGIMAGTPDLPNQIGEDEPETLTMIQYSGPFRIQFKQIAAAKDFAATTATANAQFELAWEPRIRPMLLALKAETIEIIDDRDIKVTPTVQAESSNVVLRQENPVSELNINMNAPDRKAQELKSLKVKAEVTLPAGVRTFRFPRLDVKDEKKTLGDVSLMLESTDVDEAVWKVNVNLGMPANGPAFQSYQQGLFNNRLWLQKSDGTRFEHNGGFSNTGSDGGKLGFQYLFVDAPGKPGDYGLVYETPSKVLTIPLEFEFKKIPLP